jgi:15-cis-phytoene synthase
MSGRELAAAGISDPELRSAYLACRRLHARHGKTYFLATRLLPATKRPFVHALYGFARYADEIVDAVDPSIGAAARADRLGRWGDTVLADLERGTSSDPIALALVDTVLRFGIPHDYFHDFLVSMRMDLTVREYQNFEDLSVYMHGSAAVIGRQMVHVLGTTAPQDLAEALRRADDLGVAFQLANFIRDVGEDLARGRIYLPLDELARFDITRADLRRGKVTGDMRSALAAQITRVRELQQRAQAGIPLLVPSARPCIQAASDLYCGIVDAVEEIDYQVLERRASVGLGRRAKVAGGAWLSMRRAELLPS